MASEDNNHGDGLRDSSKNARQLPTETQQPANSPDRSVWLIWAGIVLVAIAILPFAIRNQDMVRAFARMCGFDLD